MTIKMTRTSENTKTFPQSRNEWSKESNQVSKQRTHSEKEKVSLKNQKNLELQLQLVKY